MQWQGKSTLYDPGINIALGTYYLSKLVSRYGNLDLALEAYNHGPTKLDVYLKNGHHPKGYSRRVNQLYNSFKSQNV
jgi:soluble lytic murein transglycosylase